MLKMFIEKIVAIWMKEEEIAKNKINGVIDKFDSMVVELEKGVETLKKTIAEKYKVIEDINAEIDEHKEHITKAEAVKDKLKNLIS